MINNFKINNFRIFKDNTEFEISPITILTGPNNSGKSTFIRALRLIVESARSSSLLYLLQSSSDTDYLSSDDIFNKVDNEKGTSFEFTLPLSFIKIENNYDGSKEKLNIDCIVKLNYITHKSENTPELILNYLFIESNDGSMILKIYQNKKLIYNENENGWFGEIEYKYEANIDLFFEHYLEKLLDKSSIRNLLKRFYFSIDIENELINKVKSDFSKLVYMKINSSEYVDASRQKDLVNTLIDIQNISYRNLMPSKSIGDILSMLDQYKNEYKKYLENHPEIEISKDDKDILVLTLASIIDQLFKEFDTYSIEILNNLKNNILSFDHYIPAFRGKMLREFGRNDLERISKTIFKLLNKNTSIKSPSFIKCNDRILQLGNRQHLRFVNAMLNNTFNLKLEVEIIYNESKRKHEIVFNDHSNIITNNDEIGKTDKNGGIIVSSISINKDANNLTNLIDMGSGMYHLILFLIEIELAIIEGGYNYYNNKMSDAEKKLDNTSDYDKSNHTIIIEEPELSLHPNYQSLLADVIEYANNFFGIKFIIETHSEYLIRKLQLLRAKSFFDKSTVIIYNMNRPSKSNPNSEIRKIEINDDGSLTKDFGSGFVDEATKTIFELWKVHSMN